MPWPPTFQTDLPIPLDAQIASAVPAGLNAQLVPGTEENGLGVPMDGFTGILAPGVMSPDDTGIDSLETIAPKLDLKVDAKRQQVIDYALTKIGKWYVWGGESDAEGGFDCSGLLFAAFKAAGIDMPRVSYAQANRGKRVGIQKLKPGDLVAWDNNPAQAGADHIALYLGNGFILEAPHTGAKVRKRKLRANEGAWGVALDY